MLLVVMTLAARIARQLAGVEPARWAALLVALATSSSPSYSRCASTIMLAGNTGVGAVLAILSEPGRRSGAIAGACLATPICISLEGLPITAAIAGVALLAWAFDPSRRA